MASWDDVRRLALALPETTERAHYGWPAWRVRERAFAWERPLRRADLAALGDAAPDGPILAVRVPDVGVREAMIAEEPEVYFTIPHFHGYPAILVRLERIAVPELGELLIEGWYERAPARLAREHPDLAQP
jgi:hypothetical protein